MPIQFYGYSEYLHVSSTLLNKRLIQRTKAAGKDTVWPRCVLKKYRGIYAHHHSEQTLDVHAFHRAVLHNTEKVFSRYLPGLGQLDEIRELVHHKGGYGMLNGEALVWVIVSHHHFDGWIVNKNTDGFIMQFLPHVLLKILNRDPLFYQ